MRHFLHVCFSLPTRVCNHAFFGGGSPKRVMSTGLITDNTFIDWGGKPKYTPLQLQRDTRHGETVVQPFWEARRTHIHWPRR